MFWRVQRNAYGSYELAHISHVQIGPLEKKLGSQTFSFFSLHEVNIGKLRTNPRSPTLFSDPGPQPRLFPGPVHP